jgi:hypothetical protein
MKDSMNMIRKRDSVSSPGKVEIFTGVAIKTTKDTAMVKCIGLMVLATKESGRTVFKTESVEWSSQMGASKKANLQKTFLKGHV